MTWQVAVVLIVGIISIMICFCAWVGRDKPRAERCKDCKELIDGSRDMQF